MIPGRKSLPLAASAECLPGSLTFLILPSPAGWQGAGRWSCSWGPWTCCPSMNAVAPRMRPQGAAKPISSPSPLRAPPHPGPQLVHRGCPLSPTVAAVLAPGFCQLRKGLIQAVFVFGLVWFFFSLRLEALQLYSSQISISLGIPYPCSRSFLPRPLSQQAPQPSPAPTRLLLSPETFLTTCCLPARMLNKMGAWRWLERLPLGCTPPQPPDLLVFAVSP